MRNKLIAAIQITTLAFSSAAFAQNKKTTPTPKKAESVATTNMDSYLEEVKNNNPAFKATQEASEGARLRSTEGTLLILPQLELEASKTVDSTEQTVSSFNGTKNTYENYRASLLQDTPVGLKAKLSYGHNYIFTDGATGLPATFQSGYHRASPSIELSQSLWKNFFGSETRAKREAINSLALSDYYKARAKNLGVIVEAQATYNNLYYAQKTVDAFKESMDVASKLESWAKKRLNQGLGEQSDYYQTKAAYELRELEYLTALNNEKSAARAFNSLKSVDSDVVNEKLSPPPTLTFNKQNFSEQLWRDDVRAAEKGAKAAKANSLLGKERNRPTLDLFGKYAWTGLDPDGTAAHNESMADNHPVYTVGVRMTMPLAFGKVYDVTTGYEKEALAADLDFRRKAQEQERDYANLISKIETANLKMKLSSTLEESQRIKVQSERKRHGRGRTTFFQVLQFEQDYLQSQLNKIKTEAELNALLTELQQYRGE